MAAGSSPRVELENAPFKSEGGIRGNNVDVVRLQDDVLCDLADRHHGGLGKQGR